MKKIHRIIYDLSPQIFKNIILSIYYFRKYNQRYGKVFYNYLNFLEESQYWSYEKLREYQNTRLKKFLIFSYENTDYYKEIFDKANFNPYTFKDKEEIRKLPYLDKKIIRNNYDRIVPQKWLKTQKFIIEKTSGTTGSPLQFPKTIKSNQIKYAKQEFVWKIFTNYLFKDIKVAYFSGHRVKDIRYNNPPFWGYNYLTKTLYFSSYHLSLKNLSYYMEKLIEFKPEVIAGYPSSIYIIAIYIKHENIKIKVPYIWTSSETLRNYQKTVIKEAFGCKINNYYGSAEGIGPTFVCEHNKIHLMEYDNIIEIKNKLLLTNFEHYAFPFIRYIIDDNIVFDEKKCECNRIGKIVKQIDGRIEDYIITPDNKKVGRLDHIFKNVRNVIESQIVQNEINSIDLNLVVNNEFSKFDENIIVKNTKDRLGNGFFININYVDTIPRTNNKFKFVICNLQKN